PSTGRSSVSTRWRARASRTIRSRGAETRTRGGSSRAASSSPSAFKIRPGTNEVWVGDVGHNQWEEIDRVIPSSRLVENFGWPCYEGPERQHDYQGDLQIVADATLGCIWALPLKEDGLPDPERPEIVVRGAGVVVDLQIGRDGKLYYADFARGEIRLVDSA